MSSVSAAPAAAPATSNSSKGWPRQDLSTLDVSSLQPLSPLIIHHQPTLNLGVIGHVAHGKSTVVKSISGVQTVRFKTELERNITIKLGYANAKIFKCDNSQCPRPQNYKSFGSAAVANPKCERDGCGGNMVLQRHVSFVDCFGRGTQFIGFDGSLVSVESLVCGDSILGFDGSIRKVVSVWKGNKELFKVGSFICTGGHILCLEIPSSSSVSRPQFDPSSQKYSIVVIRGDDSGVRMARILFESPSEAQRAYEDFSNSADSIQFEMTVNEWMKAPNFIRESATIQWAATDKIIEGIKCRIKCREGWKELDAFGGDEDLAWIIGFMIAHPHQYQYQYQCSLPQTRYNESIRRIRFSLKSLISEDIAKLRLIASKFNIDVNVETATPLSFLSLTIHSNPSQPFCPSSDFLSHFGLITRGFCDTTSCCCEFPREFKFVNRRLRESLAKGMTSFGSETELSKFGCSMSDSVREGVSWTLHSVSPPPCSPPSVESVGCGEYFGFEVDGDGKVLLSDFAVAHNCPGHDILMATMLNGAAVMDAAMLLIAGNEPCPQPQTSEHLAAVEIMKLKHLLILQNKIDLVKEKEAAAQYEEILNFIRGTVADGSPIIPISAQLKYNIECVIEYICKKVPVPIRDFTCSPQLIVIRSFDVNKPGEEVDQLRGGVAGGSILRGVLRVGQSIEIRPGIVTKDKSGAVKCLPIVSQIVSLFSEHNELQFAVPGGLIGVGTRIDPTLTRADRLVGQVLGESDHLPEIFTELEISFFLLRRLLGVKQESSSSSSSASSGSSTSKPKGKIKKLERGEILMVNIGSTSTGAEILSVKGDLVKVVLTSPVCTSEGEKLALSRRVDKHWRLIGWGKIRKGTKIIHGKSSPQEVANSLINRGGTEIGNKDTHEGGIHEMNRLSKEADEQEKKREKGDEDADDEELEGDD